MFWDSSRLCFSVTLQSADAQEQPPVDIAEIQLPLAPQMRLTCEARGCSRWPEWHVTCGYLEHYHYPKPELWPAYRILLDSEVSIEKIASNLYFCRNWARMASRDESSEMIGGQGCACLPESSTGIPLSNKLVDWIPLLLCLPHTPSDWFYCILKTIDQHTL